MGCSPVFISYTSISESANRTCTSDPPHSETYRYRPSGAATTVYGSLGSCTVFVTTPVATSIAESVIAKIRVAKSVRPSRLMVRPPANDSPATAGSANVRARAITPSTNVYSCTLFCAAPAE